MNTETLSDSLPILSLVLCVMPGIKQPLPNYFFKINENKMEVYCFYFFPFPKNYIIINKVLLLWADLTIKNGLIIENSLLVAFTKMGFHIHMYKYFHFYYIICHSPVFYIKSF